MTIPWKNHVQVVARRERLASLARAREARKRAQPEADVGAGGDMPPSAPAPKQPKVASKQSKSTSKSNEPPTETPAQDSPDTEDEDR